MTSTSIGTVCAPLKVFFRRDERKILSGGRLRVAQTSDVALHWGLGTREKPGA